MKRLVNDYREFSVTVDGMSIVFFLNSGFSLAGTAKTTASPHSHYHYEMFFVLEGEMCLTVGDTTQRIERGECVLVPKNLVHTPTYSDETLRIALAFNIMSVKKSDSVIYRRLKTMMDRDCLTVIKNSLLEETFRRMIRFYYGNFEFGKEIVSGCLEEMILLICQTDTSSREVGIGVLDDSKNYRSYLIQEYFSRPAYDRSFLYSPLSLDELSEFLHLSKKQTQRTVRRVLGRSFSEHITYLKVMRAAVLLKDTDMTVGEISSSVGYASSRSFFYAFKKEFGKTPLEYRIEEKKKNLNKTV